MIGTIVGIDPGITGAIVALDDRGVLLWWHDTPVTAAASGSGNKREYLAGEMARLLRDVARDRSRPAAVWIERQQAYPGQGTSSTYKTGYGAGLWAGICAGVGLPLHVVSPREWQKIMLGFHGGDTKAKSLTVCSRMFPSIKLSATHHGRSDAALIAEYGRRQLAKERLAS